MPRLDRHARRLSVSVGLGVLAVELLRATAALAFASGGAMLVLRLGLGRSGAEAARLAPALLLALPWAAWRAWSLRVDRRTAVRWLDVRSGGAGALVTELELADPRWRPRAEERLSAAAPRLPRPRLVAPALAALGGLAFALLALALGAPVRDPGPAPEFFDAWLQRLETRVATLAAQGALDPERDAELAERLASLRDAIDGGRAASLYEAFDRFEEGLGQDASRLARGAQALASALGALDRLGGGALGADPADLLARLGERLADPEALRLAAGLVERLGADPAALAGVPVPEALRSLFAEDLGRLAGAGVLDPDAVRAALERARGRLEGYAETALAAHACGEACERAGRCIAGLAGELAALGGPSGFGGITRGPGAAPLRFGDEAPDRAERFQLETLAPSRRLDPEHAADLVESAEAPEVAPEGEAGGLGDVGAAGGATAWQRRLAPRHRRAVAGFFGTAAEGDG